MELKFKKAVKYLYFEIHSLRSNPDEKQIKRENILLLEPKTNSSGIWGFTTITDIHSAHGSVQDQLWINQYWIDFTKYDLDNPGKIDEYVLDVLIMIKEKIRKMEKDRATKLLEDLFNHITKPSKSWPKTTIGKRTTNDTIWSVGGVDDEFRDYLVSVEKYLKDKL